MKKKVEEKNYYMVVPPSLAFDFTVCEHDWRIVTDFTVDRDMLGRLYGLFMTCKKCGALIKVYA